MTVPTSYAFVLAHYPIETKAIIKHLRAGSSTQRKCAPELLDWSFTTSVELGAPLSSGQESLSAGPTWLTARKGRWDLSRPLSDTPSPVLKALAKQNENRRAVLQALIRLN